MSSALRELRLACRRLAARPVLVVVAVASVGLGIGVNAAVYSLFNTVLLQAPTAVDPARLVRVEFGNGNHVSYANARDLMDTRVVDGIAAYAFASVNVRVVGLQPSVGRAFTKEDDAVVITEGFSRRHRGRY